MCVRRIQQWLTTSWHMPALQNAGILVPTHKQLVLATLDTRDTRVDGYPGPSRTAVPLCLGFLNLIEEFSLQSCSEECLYPNTTIIEKRSSVNNLGYRTKRKPR